MRLKFKCLSLGFGVSALMIGAVAMAAGAGGMQHHFAPPQQHSAMAAAARHTPKVSPQTMSKFKQAYRSVKSVEKEYSAKMRNVHGKKGAQSVRQWARTKMVNAIKSAGMTVQKYNHVMMMVQRNPALRKQVMGQ